MINPGVLESTFLPRLLPYRENEHKYIAECIKPLIEKRNGRSLLITGGPGIGKTACVKFIFRKMIEEGIDNIITLYVNCWKSDTSQKIAYRMAEQLSIRTEGKYSEEITDLVIKKLNTYDGVVFAFDEIDRLQDWNLIYRILEDVRYKTILMITNIPESIARLDSRLLSRLMVERLDFKPYNYEEIRGILREREQYAFAPNSWDYDAFEQVIKRVHEAKDIRVGLFLLKHSAELAESRGSEKIMIEDVNAAIEKLKDFYTKGLQRFE